MPGRSFIGAVFTVVEQDDGYISIRKSGDGGKGDAWGISDHPRWGILVYPIGASLIPFCPAIVEDALTINRQREEMGKAPMVVSFSPDHAAGTKQLTYHQVLKASDAEPGAPGRVRETDVAFLFRKDAMMAVESVWWSKNHGDGYGQPGKLYDVRDVTVSLYATWEEFAKTIPEVERMPALKAKALAKLTQEERAAIGFGEWQP